MFYSASQPFTIITQSSTLDVAAVLDPPLISIFLCDVCFTKYANKRCYVLLILFLYAGSSFYWVSPTLSSLLFCSSCRLLFQIMNDGTTNNFLKYEKAVILFNFSLIFFEPPVSYFISKIARQSKYINIYKCIQCIQISNSDGEN